MGNNFCGIMRGGFFGILGILASGSELYIGNQLPRYDGELEYSWEILDDRIYFTLPWTDGKYASIGINGPPSRQSSSAGMAKAEIVVFGVVPRVFDSQAYLHQYYGQSYGNGAPNNEATYWRLD